MSHASFQPTGNRLYDWIEYRLPIFSTLNNALGVYPTPRNLSYMWNFGSLAGMCLVIQILTGIFLAMNYTAHVDYAFDSVERIMRDVNYGWLMRYMHAVGASMFFAVVYIHIARGLYYGSYKKPRELLWFIGIVIFLLMMATAFMGYVLPWGQMSFWGATVITNLFSAIPLVGDSIVTWLWGGFSVENPTLNRFYALHYLLPFVIAAFSGLHLMALHQHGSNNPLGIDVQGPQDTIPFHPYYTIKDFLGFGVFFLIFAAFIFYSPNSLGHPDNYIPANPMVTPPHIVPEWYFLPFYAILRAIVFNIPLWLGGVGIMALSLAPIAAQMFNVKSPVKLGLFGSLFVFTVGLVFTLVTAYTGAVIEGKLGGVVAMIASILILFLLPWLDFSPVRSGRFRPVFRIFYATFIINFILLGYIGSQPAEGIFIPIGQLATAYYFGYFLVILPLLSKFEKTLPLPESIATPVLKGKIA
jgi:quinol-cytochrome oxidoreductase complex cytochrome b subunit